MIVRSREPMIDIPEVPLVDFAFATHNDFDKKQLEKPWIVCFNNTQLLIFLK